MKKQVDCISLQVLDDEFNKATKDRAMHINAYIHFPKQKLIEIEAEENVVVNALFKIKTTDFGMKKLFVLHCRVYSVKAVKRVPKIFMKAMEEIDVSDATDNDQTPHNKALQQKNGDSHKVISSSKDDRSSKRSRVEVEEEDDEEKDDEDTVDEVDLEMNEQIDYAISQGISMLHKDFKHFANIETTNTAKTNSAISTLNQTLTDLKQISIESNKLFSKFVLRERERSRSRNNSPNRSRRQVNTTVSNLVRSEQNNTPDNSPEIFSSQISSSLNRNNSSNSPIVVSNDKTNVSSNDNALINDRVKYLSEFKIKFQDVFIKNIPQARRLDTIKEIERDCNVQYDNVKRQLRAFCVSQYPKTEANRQQHGFADFDEFLPKALTSRRKKKQIEKQSGADNVFEDS